MKRISDETRCMGGMCDLAYIGNLKVGHVNQRFKDCHSQVHSSKYAVKKLLAHRSLLLLLQTSIIITSG